MAMEGRDVNADKGSSPSAAALVDIVARHAGRRQRYLGEELRDLLEKCFVEAEGCDQLRVFHNQAARAAIKTGSLDLLRFLLSKDSTRSLLSDNPDNLQLAICVPDNTLPDAESIEMLELLLQHGAHINGFDEQGNTPLYYTCTLGLPSAFKFLIGNGADFATEHKLSGSPLSDDSTKLEARSLAVDLMRVAIHAMESHLDFVVCEQCASIILFFIDKRFSNPLPEKVFTKLMQAACSNGDVDVVGKILSPQANQDVASYASGLNPVFVGSRPQVCH